MACAQGGNNEMFCHENAFPMCLPCVGTAEKLVLILFRKIKVLPVNPLCKQWDLKGNK